MPRRVTGAARPSATLRYNAAKYTPAGLETWPDKELRAEYTRLRDIAQKRIKRLSRDPVAQTSSLYREFEHGFARLRDIKTREGLERAMADVSRFVRARGSTVTGARESLQRRTALMTDVTLDDVEPDEYMSLDEWMALGRESGEPYDSDVAVMYYREKAGQQLSIKDYYAWARGEREYSEAWDMEPGSSSDEWDFSSI